MQSSLNHASHSQAELPEHWEMRVDTRTGLPYYLNHQDQYTTWDDPRLVSRPRGMLNTAGSMLRPQHHQRPRQASVEPSSSSNRYFTTPIQPEDHVTHSLPRRVKHTQPQPIFRRPFMDDWLGHGFKQFDTDFHEPDWPFKAHTIQREHPARAQSMQPTPSQSRFNPQQQQFHQEECRGFPIPVRVERPQPQDVTDNRYEGEHYIIPTQYKRGNQSSTKPEQGEARVKLPNAQEPQHQSQAGQPSQKDSVDDSNEDAILRRMSAVDQDVNSNDITESQKNTKKDDQPLPVPRVKIVVEEHTDTKKVQDDATNTQPEVDSTTEVKEEKVERADEPENVTPSEAENDTVAAAVKSSYQAIDKIIAEVDSYKVEVEKFKGEKTSKEYRYLEEMLTRCQLALDNVETHGDVQVRKKRKETVNYIESILRTLESKSDS